MNKTHKGFTTIEMLIVLAIIIILGGIMAVMNRNAKSSLAANHIIHDFRSLKTAAQSWHNNNRGREHDRSEILSYLNNRTAVSVSETSEGKGKYILHISDDGKSWYIGCDLSDDAKTKGRLSAKAETFNLLGSDMKSLYKNDSQVWVQVHLSGMNRAGI